MIARFTLLAAICMGWTFIASAAEHSYEVFVTFTDSEAPAEIAMGDRARLVLTYEDNIPDSITTNDNPIIHKSLFSNAVTYLSMELLPGSSGNYSKATASRGNIELSHYAFPPTTNEAFRVLFDTNYSDMNFGSLNGDPFGFIWLRFEDVDLNVFIDNELTLAEQIKRDITEFNLDPEPGVAIQLYTGDPNYYGVFGNIDSVSRLVNPTNPTSLSLSATNESMVSFGIAGLLTNAYYNALRTTNLVNGIWSTVATFKATSETTNVVIVPHDNAEYYHVRGRFP